MESFKITNKKNSLNRILVLEELIENLSTQNLDISQKEDLINAFIIDQIPFGFPIIEETTVYFIYRGSAISAYVSGDFNYWDPDDELFLNISDVDFFYLQKTFEIDARFEYNFVINSTWILDPLNNRTIEGWNEQNSELVMPSYFDDSSYLFNSTEFFNEELGTIHSVLIRSNVQDGWMRYIYVYLPPNYDPNGTTRYKTFYTHDGSAYVHYGYAKNVLDYLIYNNLTEPLIGIFVDPIRFEWRGKEYASTECDVELDKWYNPGKEGICYEKYTEFFATELVPYIDSHYLTINQSEYRGILGASLGGFISVYISSQHREVFKLVGSHSGAFWPGRTAYQTYQYFPRIDGMRFYLNCGTYGLDSALLDETLEFAEILKEKEYPGKLRIFHQAHSFGQWRATLSEMLIFLFTNETSDYTGSPHFPLPVTTTNSSSTTTSFSETSSTLSTSDITENITTDTSETANATFYFGLFGFLIVILTRRKITFK
ncbi:MAG: alpha/beta hydrolase-fold protein [Candidatus Hodarchaeales archaeon]|jgi:enterochelin esterase family protein